MPPNRGQGAGKGNSRKRSAPSIRDAAASAAGSAGTTPRPRSRPSTPKKRATSSRRPARPEPGPPFPDFETPARTWDPWDPASGAEVDGRGGFDPQRTLGDWLEAVIPPEAQVHFIRAGQEFAAGIQTTVEHHLGRGSGAGAGNDGATRIEIE